MSYAIYLEIDTGAEELYCFETRDCTSNVSPMWRKAIEAATGEDLTLAELIEKYPAATDLESRVLRASDYMAKHMPEFETMNPPNGWGDAQGALEILVWLALKCGVHTKCTVGVWR